MTRNKKTDFLRTFVVAVVTFKLVMTYSSSIGGNCRNDITKLSHAQVRGINLVLIIELVTTMPYTCPTVERAGTPIRQSQNVTSCQWCRIDYWPEFYISELAQVFFRTTVLSSRDPISIPVMTTNFKGPVFWLQDCSREIMLWKRGSLRTTVWLASWYRMSLPVRFSSQS